MTRNTHNRRIRASLTATSPTAFCLRDGEVVIYRRTRNLLYQCRYKLADGAWHRQTTGKASIEHTIASACNLYDEARHRQRLGLAHQAHSFTQFAPRLCERSAAIHDLQSANATSHLYSDKSGARHALRGRDVRSSSTRLAAQKPSDTGLYAAIWCAHFGLL